MYIYAGALAMSGNANITNNSATYGGGVYVDESTLTMSNGTITNNSATNCGGGVYIYAGTFEMSGNANITNNSATYGGGIFDYNGTLTVSGGSVTKNEASSEGGGVYVRAYSSKSTFNMNAGTISENKALNNGGGVYVFTNSTSDTGEFNMSGGTITGNSVTNTSSANCFGGGIYADKYSKLNISGDSEITNNTAPCGGGICSTGTFTMENGTVSGNTATTSGGGIYNYGTFTMSGGSINSNHAGKNGGGVVNHIHSGSNGVFNMENGTISGNTADSYGGGVYNLYGNFTMSDGSISNNIATELGGGICNGQGTVTILKGSITGNNSTEYGGGIHNEGALSLGSTSSTVNITGNTSGGSYPAGGVYWWAENGSMTISGTVNITGNTTNNVAANLIIGYSEYNGGSTINTETLNSGTNIGFILLDEDDSETDGILTSGYIENNSGAALEQYFHYDGSTYRVVWNDTKKEIRLALICGCSADLNIQPWTDTSKLPDTSGHYFLTGDVTVSSTWEPENGTYLCLNGHTVTMTGSGSVIKVNSGVEFTLADCSESGSGTVTGGNADNGGGVYVEGTFNMNGGTISGNTAANNGGGVYVDGIFNVSGKSSVQNNTSNGIANNVYLPSGKTVIVNTSLSGGTIGVTTEVAPADNAPVAVTGTNNNNYSRYFSSDNTDYKIYNDSNTVKLKVNTNDSSTNTDSGSGSNSSSDSSSSSTSSSGLTSDKSSDIEPQIKNDDSKIGWDIISDELEKAEEGDEVIVDMNGTSKLPKDILSDIMGKDINLTLDMNNGIFWTINGEDVTSPKTVDMNVYKGINHIPDDVLDTVAKDKTYVELGFAHNSNFGFTATMTIELGSKNNGQYANLFHYDDSEEKMIFGDYCEILNGKAKLMFSSASDSVIVIGEDVLSNGEDVSSSTGMSINDELMYFNTQKHVVYAVELLVSAFVAFAARRKKARK